MNFVQNASSCLLDVTYSWKTGDWSKECDSNCGLAQSTRNRSVNCQDQNGDVVSDSNCSSSKPNSSEICAATASCRNNNI